MSNKPQRERAGARVVLVDRDAAALTRLQAELGGSFIPPQIRTLDSWLEQQPPDIAAEPAATSTERLMALYASLRETPWLKKLFAAGN